MIDIDGRIIGFFPSTEYEQAKKKSTCDEVIDISRSLHRISLEKKLPPQKAAVVLEYLLTNGIRTIQVPETFPVLEADFLREHGIQIQVKEEPFYPERLIKTQSEIEFIRSNSKLNVEVMNEVYTLLASCSVNSNKELLYNSELLTSEFVQAFILKLFLDRDLYSQSVIVAGGDQACDPHEQGYGALKSEEAIVVDIFPQSRTNYYYADMTRTFCKHRASYELQKLYNTVKEAQLKGLSSVKDGACGKAIHADIQQYFKSEGYETGNINGVLQGFFHGTGHGVGLDCHEGPYISANGTKLQKDEIVTVEPGLYYWGIGGVRIEDLVLVTADGYENLSDYPKELIVP